MSLGGLVLFQIPSVDDADEKAGFIDFTVLGVLFKIHLESAGSLGILLAGIQQTGDRQLLLSRKTLVGVELRQLLVVVHGSGGAGRCSERVMDLGPKFGDAVQSGFQITPLPGVEHDRSRYFTGLCTFLALGIAPARR